MAKMTLLKMTQKILSSMDSDNVNSISATVESDQIAELIEDSYYELINRDNFPFMKEWTVLENVGDTAKPNKIKIPDTVKRLDFNEIPCVRYNVSQLGDSTTSWRTLKYLEPVDFVVLLQSRDNSQTNITTVTTDTGTEFYVINDQAPTFFTSFDDEFLWFDSYDSTLDTTITQDKTNVFAVKESPWTKADSFVPDLPESMFPILLNEAKSMAWLQYKQQAHAKAEQLAKRLYNNIVRNNAKVNNRFTTWNLGRSRRNRRV